MLAVAWWSLTYLYDFIPVVEQQKELVNSMFCWETDPTYQFWPREFGSIHIAVKSPSWRTNDASPAYCLGNASSDPMILQTDMLSQQLPTVPRKLRLLILDALLGVAVVRRDLEILGTYYWLGGGRSHGCLSISPRIPWGAKLGASLGICHMPLHEKPTFENIQERRTRRCWKWWPQQKDD